MELSIVILNYKTKGLLKQCLRGIVDCQLPFEYEVLVVDNNSRDGSIEMVQELYPQFTVIASPRNDGFAAGNNLGLRQARGRYIMVLNPDVAIFRGAVEVLRSYLEEHPAVGLAAPKLINPDGSTQQSCMMFPSFWIPLWRRTPLGQLPGPKRTIGRYLMDEFDHAASMPIGWALGACFFIRRAALEAVGFFDERFFLYLEDVDFCRRLWVAGWEVHYVPAAEMVHYHQRLSAEQSDIFAVFSYPARIHIRSWITYFAKYLGSPKPPHSL